MGIKISVFIPFTNIAKISSTLKFVVLQYSIVNESVVARVDKLHGSLIISFIFWKFPHYSISLDGR